jgi:hypothetical protein
MINYMKNDITLNVKMLKIYLLKLILTDFFL